MLFLSSKSKGLLLKKRMFIRKKSDFCDKNVFLGYKSKKYLILTIANLKIMCYNSKVTLIKVIFNKRDMKLGHTSRGASGALYLQSA